MEQYLTLVGKVCAPQYIDVFTPEVESDLPIEASSEGRNLKDWEIIGNDSPNHLDNSEGVLPLATKSATAGAALDWRIDGNNVPQVESTTEVLPLTFPSNGDNVTDYTIYGNDNPCEPDQTLVLPITFETVEDKLRDWEIRGNDNVGENLFDESNFSLVKVTSTAYRYGTIIGILPQGTYTLTATKATSAQNLFLTKKNNDTYTYEATANVPYTFTADGVSQYILRIAEQDVYESWAQVGYSQMMIVEGSTAPDHFIPYQQGVGERTVNLFDVNKVTDRTASGHTFLRVVNDEIIVDLTVSTSTPDGDNHTLRDIVGNLELNQAYTLNATSTGSNQFIYLSGTGANFAWALNSTTKTFTTQESLDAALDARVLWYASGANTTATISNIMLVKGSTAPSTYVPYGYEIPISVNGTSQTFYIGSTPLTEGQSISKTSTGVDITTQVGENTISTTLYNKPVMYCGKALGVGMPTSGSEPAGYKVPITITDENSNTIERTIYTGNSRLLEGQSITKAQAGIDIPTTSGNNIISTTLYNKPQMNVVCNSNVLGVGQKTNDGYILPITVTDSSNNSTPYTFQLGSQPLAQGQSISKSTTHSDITLYSGVNTISTSLDNKPNMMVEYVSGETGVGVPTKNLLEITTNTQTINGITFTVDKQTGTITANGTASATTVFRIVTSAIPQGDYYFSGCPENGTSSTYNVFVWDNTTQARIKKWDGTTTSNYDYGSGSQEMQMLEGHEIAYSMRIREGVAVTNIVFRPMIRLADTSSDFEPYGYKVPIRIYNKDRIRDDIPQFQRDLIGAVPHQTQVTLQKGQTSILFDVIGVDHDTCYYPDGRKAKHSVTVQSHDCVASLQFCARQALFTFPYGCPIGTYHFKLVNQPWYASDVGKSMQFTLTKAIPEGGQLVINNARNATMIGATISSYASPSTTTALESVTMSQGTSGTNLGDVANATNGNTNSIQRVFLGSNNYQYSAMRQWLNSNGVAGSVWTPQTPFDRPPSWASNIAGFLNGIDTDVQALIGECNKITALNTVTDGGGSYTSKEKVFLLSKTEVYSGNENNIAEGAAYAYYSDYSDLSAAAAGADSNRIKYQNGSAKTWWLRSPLSSNPYNERCVVASGATAYTDTYGNQGVAPAFVIPMDEIYEYEDVDVYIGASLLVNGASVTKNGTGVNIRLNDGDNIIDTQLYNNPSMYIK